MAQIAAMEACRGRWAPALRAAAADPSPAIRAGVAGLVEAVGEPGLLAELRPLLSDPDPDVAGASEATFVALASGRHPGTRPELERQVAAALGEFDRHRRRGILGAAVGLADVAFAARVGVRKGGPLDQMLGDETQPFQMALRSFIRKSEDPAVRARAWDWLPHGLAPQACLERLSRALSVEDHEAVLARAHLVENPRRAARLRRFQEGAGAHAVVTLGSHTVAELTVGARRGLARLLAALDVPHQVRSEAGVALSGDPDPGVRLASMRIATPRAMPAACADRDPRIAAAALRRCSTVGLERKRALGRPDRERLPPESGWERAVPVVRELVRQELDRSTPWDARSPASRLTARERLRASPAEFIGEIRQRLAGTDPSGAVMLVRALGLHARFEGQLLGLLHAAPELGPEDRLTPTLLGALGELGSDAARLAVDAHLRDARTRARANAVEALARQARSAAPGDRRADVLIEFKDDPQHRVRANAIRGLFQRGRLFGEPGAVIEEPVAFDALGLMLSDRRPDHRLAAIWLAGRVLPPAAVPGRRWSEIAGRITDLARSDPDARARTKAGRTASRLLMGMREGWKSAAADTGLEAIAPGSRA